MSCFYGTGMALTERPEITFSPDTPIICEIQHGRCEPTTPWLGGILLSPDDPHVWKLVPSPYTYNDLIYECPPECSWVYTSDKTR